DGPMHRTPLGKPVERSTPAAHDPMSRWLKAETNELPWCARWNAVIGSFRVACGAEAHVLPHDACLRSDARERTVWLLRKRPGSMGREIRAHRNGRPKSTCRDAVTRDPLMGPAEGATFAGVRARYRRRQLQTVPMTWTGDDRRPRM